MCLGLLASAAPAATAASISIENGPCSPVPSGTAYCYSPPSQTAASGEQVTWANVSAAPHTVTRCTVAACGVSGGTGTDSWNGTGNNAIGASGYSYTFTGAGTYVYYCAIHGYAAMHGTIVVTAGGAEPPVAMFTFSPSNPTTGQSVTFDASSSTAPSGDTITKYHWNFGDGTAADTATATTTHTYASAGTFRAVLTVTDSEAVTSGQFQAQVTVTGAGVDTPPTASFTFSPANPVSGQTITFDASATADQDGDSVSQYAWNFGDGTTAMGGPTVTHAYAGAGMFGVTLVATDANGNPSAPASMLVTVAAPPTGGGGGFTGGGGGSSGPGGGSQGPTQGTTARATKMRLTAKRLCKKKRAHCKLTKARLTFRLSAAARLAIVIERRGKAVRRLAVHGKAGANSLQLSAAGLKPGRYTLVLTPAGGKAIMLKFAVVGV
jgi:plastocyanin